MSRRHFATGSIYDSLKSNRSYLDFDELSDKTCLCWKLFQPLFLAADGVIEGADVALLEPDERVKLRQLHRQGYVRIYVGPGQLEMYSFHSPLHLLYYQVGPLGLLRARNHAKLIIITNHPLQVQLLESRAQRVLTLTGGTSTIEFFLQMCISCMSSGQLKTTQSVGTNGKRLERKLQMEFHQAAISVLPPGHNVCPDVGKVKFLSFGTASGAI